MRDTAQKAFVELSARAGSDQQQLFGGVASSCRGDAGDRPVPRDMNNGCGDCSGDTGQGWWLENHRTPLPDPPPDWMQYASSQGTWFAGPAPNCMQHASAGGMWSADSSFDRHYWRSPDVAPDWMQH